MKQSCIPLATGSKKQAPFNTGIKPSTSDGNFLDRRRKLHDFVANKKTHLPFQWDVKQPKYIVHNQFGTTNAMQSS